MIKLVALVLLLLAACAEAHEFTSIDGASFRGTLVLVEPETVTIKRDSDGKEFTLPKSRFSEADRTYFINAVRYNPKLAIPGRNVQRISLRVKTISRTVDYDDSKRSSATAGSEGAIAKIEKRGGNRSSGASVLAEASSISGPVMARIHILFYAKGSSGHAHSTHEDIIIDSTKHKAVATCPPIRDFYGFGTVAVNLATGSVVGIDASNHQIKKLLEVQARNGKFAP